MKLELLKPLHAHCGNNEGRYSVGNIFTDGVSIVAADERRMARITLAVPDLTIKRNTLINWKMLKTIGATSIYSDGNIGDDTNVLRADILPYYDVDIRWSEHIGDFPNHARIVPAREHFDAFKQTFRIDLDSTDEKGLRRRTPAVMVQAVVETLKEFDGIADEALVRDAISCVRAFLKARASLSSTIDLRIRNRKSSIMISSDAANGDRIDCLFMPIIEN